MALGGTTVGDKGRGRLSAGGISSRKRRQLRGCLGEVLWRARPPPGEVLPIRAAQ